MEKCRCGHIGEENHPCHGNGYSCCKPAKFRLYNPYGASLAGNAMKLCATGTWACDECWEDFKNIKKD